MPLHSKKGPNSLTTPHMNTFSNKLVKFDETIAYYPSLIQAATPNSGLLDEKTELQYSTSNGIIDINPLLQIIIQWYPALRIYVSNPSYWNGKAQAGVQESIG